MKTIGIIAPADWLEDDLLDAGAEALEKLGFTVKIHPQCREKYGRMAGEDTPRAAMFNEFLADESIDILWAAKGGYGSYRILDQIDYKLWKKTAKPLIGYSDITCLAMAGYARAGVKSFIGPMIREVALEKQPKCIAELIKNILNDTASLTPLVEHAAVLHEGTASGVLVGGTLACLADMIGTPFDLPANIKTILAIEDICETNYRLDKFLRHIRYSPWGQNIQGLLVGSMTSIEDSSSRPFGFELKDIWTQNFPNAPIITDVQFGHGDTNYSLPIGLDVQLEVEGRNVSLKQVIT